MAGVRASCEMDTSPTLKKRKVRKGTQSCWECKRRKIRCTFVNSTEPVCDGCRSRQVKCISQEFCSDTSAPKISRGVKADQIRSRKVSERGDVHAVTSGSQQTWTKTNPKIGNNARVAPTFCSTSTHTTGTTSNSSFEAKGRYDELCGKLLAAWPSQPELDLMAKVTVEISVLFHGIVCMPYSKFLSKRPQSPEETLERPPAWSHPVFIARKLLMLGAFLQGIPPSAIHNLGSVGKTYHATMAHVVEEASRLVTSNDNLVDSIEGIECLMIESMYQNNAGNLRRAWLINRRAMMIAEMLGLHLTERSLPPNMLDAETRSRIDPDYMWVRLVMSDQYLSLILGLPPGSQDKSFAAPKVLSSCEPLEQLDRLQAAAGGLLLQRKKEDLHNLEMTHEIDKSLKDAAALMPAQWWLAPDTAPIAASDADAFREIIRITKQFAHYHMLAQLHLPYLLRSSPDGKSNASKITAAYASREILSRFVNFRAAHLMTAYCRGIDFLAFVASTTLCLAHIDAHRQDEIGVHDSAAVFRFLGHQRLGDRGLMERTLQIMEKIVDIRSDSVACKVADILRPLLAIEAAVANGDCYTAIVSSGRNEHDAMPDDGKKDNSKVLCVDISHVGTIRIERGGVLRYAARKAREESIWPNGTSSTTPPIEDFQSHSTSPPNRANSYSMRQCSPPAALVTSYQTIEHPLHTSWQDTPSNLGFGGVVEMHLAPPNNNEFTALQSGVSHTKYLPASRLASDVDDFVLQGVDIAIFDNLFEGWEPQQ